MPLAGRSPAFGFCGPGSLNSHKAGTQTC